jgi:hypothetical protein
LATVPQPLTEKAAAANRIRASEGFFIDASYAIVQATIKANSRSSPEHLFETVQVGADLIDHFLEAPRTNCLGQWAGVRCS